MTQSPHTIELAFERFLAELAVEVLSKPEDREEWVAAAEEHLAAKEREPLADQSPPPQAGTSVPASPPPDGLCTPAEAAPKPRKPPPLDRLLKQAAKADKNVKGAEVYPDRTVLQFGEPEQQQGNEVDEWIAKHADKTQGH